MLTKVKKGISIASILRAINCTIKTVNLWVQLQDSFFVQHITNTLENSNWKLENSKVDFKKNKRKNELNFQFVFNYDSWESFAFWLKGHNMSIASILPTTF